MSNSHTTAYVNIESLSFVSHSDDNSSLKGLSVLRKVFVFLHLPLAVSIFCRRNRVVSLASSAPCCESVRINMLSMYITGLMFLSAK